MAANLSNERTKPMDTSLQPDQTAQILDSSGTIDTDVVCRRCGYNLRGLRPSGRCPECGTPIGLSVSGDLLRFADPSWVETLALGIRYILWGLAASFFFSIAGGIVTRFVNPLFGQLLHTAGSLLAFYGAYLLTEPDPSGIGEDRYVSARRIIRIALLLGVLSTLLLLPAQARVVTGTTALVLTVVASVVGLSSVIGEFAKLVYLEKLALRIPEPKYAARARYLRWAYTGTMTVLLGGGILLTLIVLTARPTGSGVVAGGIAGVMGPAAILALVFLLMYLRLQYRLGQAFREQASIARATWAQAGATGV